jgi:hypothetical protein
VEIELIFENNCFFKRTVWRLNMVDEYDVEQIKRKLEKEFQCNRNCSPDWEMFWKRLKK